MTPYILAALGLYFIQTFAPSLTRFWLSDQSAVKIALGPRDDLPEASVKVQRFARATENMKEALFLFLPVALLCEIHGVTGGAATTAAAVFVVARLVYVPCYVFHPPYLRPLVWFVGVGSVMVMAWQLLQAL